MRGTTVSSFSLSAVRPADWLTVPDSRGMKSRRGRFFPYPTPPSIAYLSTACRRKQFHAIACTKFAASMVQFYTNGGCRNLLCVTPIGCAEILLESGDVGISRNFQKIILTSKFRGANRPCMQNSKIYSNPDRAFCGASRNASTSLYWDAHYPTRCWSD